MFKEIVDTMVQIADTRALPDGCRQLAMEFLVSLAENAPATCRKLPKNGFVASVFPVVFRMMLEHDDVDSWSVATCEEALELLLQEISNFDVGREALERLVGAIGAKKSLPKCFAIIQEYAAQADSWLHRDATLVGLCQILEALESRELDGIVRHLLGQCHDPHPRVCLWRCSRLIATLHSTVAIQTAIGGESTIPRKSVHSPNSRPSELACVPSDWKLRDMCTPAFQF